MVDSIKRTVSVAKDRDVLRKRIRRLLRLDRGADDKSELRNGIIPFLQSLGEVALIGGAIRDVARAGRRAFNSDLDFVIYGSSKEKLYQAMADCGAISNRFGGFGIPFHFWKVDVWHLEDTWARTAGLRQVETINDLLKCTFFDWDSVVFDLNTGTLSCDDAYLNRLSNGIMETCLEENPNPEGSLVRALRRAALWRVGFGEDLTTFSIRLLHETNWDSLVARDKAAFRHPILTYLDRDDILKRLSELQNIGGVQASFPIPNWEVEPILPFGN